MSKIDSLAKQFAAVGSDLGVALTEHLDKADPVLTAKLAQALDRGERLVLAVEFALDASCIRLATLDDYENLRPVMRLQGDVPGRH